MGNTPSHTRKRSGQFQGSLEGLEGKPDAPAAPAPSFEQTYPVTEDYELGATLSVSWQGELRLATHRATGVVYVVRSMKKIDFEERDIREALIRHKLHFRLSHPGLVALFAVFNDAKYLSAVYERVEGGSLFDAIHRAERYTEREAAGIIRQLLAVLAYLHANNIVHRDVKPENLMYNAATGRLTLVSLSLCRVLEPGKRLSSCRGTPSYMAPETVAGSYDAKVDVWACGIILYALVTGRLPFNAINDEEVLAQVSHGRYDADAPEFERFSPDAKRLVHSLLTHDPDARPSAEEAARHAWFAGPLSDEPIARPRLRRLKAPVRYAEIGAAIFRVFVEHFIAGEEKQALARAFAAIDKNDDCLLTKREFKEAATAGRVQLSPGDVERVLLQFHRLRHPLTLEEFAQAMLYRKRLISEQNIKACYRLLQGRKGEGELVVEDLRLWIFAGFSAQQWAEFVEHIGKGEGDAISYGEFRQLMRQFIATFG